MKSKISFLLVALAAATSFAGSLTVGCPTSDVGEFREIAEFAKSIGATHVDASQIEHSLWQWNADRRDPYPHTQRRVHGRVGWQSVSLLPPLLGGRSSELQKNHMAQFLKEHPPTPTPRGGRMAESGGRASSSSLLWWVGASRTFSCSRSGLSMLTTAASSWSSRPSLVTVKLIRVA